MEHERCPGEQLLQPSKLELICGVKRVQMSPAFPCESFEENSPRGCSRDKRDAYAGAGRGTGGRGGTRNDMEEQNQRFGGEKENKFFIPLPIKVPCTH